MKKNKAVYRLAKRDYRHSYKGHLMTILAVMLTTFMITVILSLGLSSWDAITKRNLILEGAKFDVQLPEPSEEQVEQVRQLENVVSAGVVVKCAIAENIQDSNEMTRLYWGDNIYWEKQCIPALEFFEGSYPEKENEIVLSMQTLKEIGITEPALGMDIKLEYYNLSETDTTTSESHLAVKTFKLSGYFRDYSSNSRGFVSEIFYKTTGAKQTDFTQGFLTITLDNPIYTPDDINKMSSFIQLRDNQFIWSNSGLSASFIRSAIGISLLLLIVFLSGALFIYNVMYISINKKIRFFGKLKLVGMSELQIKKFLRYQVLFNGIVGILLGLLGGGIVSYFVVPYFSHLANPELQISENIVFRPGVYLVAAVFAMLNAVISTSKPVRIASSISPVESSKYISVKSSKKSKHKKGNLIFNMARKNSFANKKRAMVVILSFILTATAYLTVSSIALANSSKKILDHDIHYDFRIINQTILKTKEQVITNEFISKIEQETGVKRVEKVISTEIAIPYDENTLEAFFKETSKDPIAGITDYENSLASYLKNPEQDEYLGSLVGIDESKFDKINKSLNNSLNKDDFLSGKTAIIDSFFAESVLEETIVGGNINFHIPTLTKNTNILVAAMYPRKEVGLPNYAARGLLPDIIISNVYAEQIIEEPVIELIDIEFDESFDGETDAAIRKMILESGLTDKFMTSSKFSEYEEMGESDKQIKALGNALVFVLLLISIMNCINTHVADIQNRIKEFAILQSLGMTIRQIHRVLHCEGLYYGIISAVLSIIIGVPISYIIYQATRKLKVTFEIPIAPNLLFLFIILIICVVLPSFVYRFVEKENILYQIKNEE